MTRLLRAALTGLGAFVSELIPAQTLTKAERALLSAEALHEVLEPQQFPCSTLGECWHDIHGYTCPYPCNRECPDPAAPDAAAPSPEPPTGDTEPAGANFPVAPAGSTNELAADLVYAAGVVRAYAWSSDLDAREIARLNALSIRLVAAAEAAQ